MSDDRIRIERCIHGLDINSCYICQQFKKMEKPILKNEEIENDNKKPE